jgi:hypothetical protein
MNQKTKIVFVVLVLAISLFPLTSFAGEYKLSNGATVHYEGLVPCGKSQAGPGESAEVTMPCQLCHFFVMGKGILDFVLKIVIIVAVLMFVISGFMFLFSESVLGLPTLLSRAKSIIGTTIWGLVIIFSAWIIVNTIFLLIGVADWTGLREGWFKIECPITLESGGSGGGTGGGGPVTEKPLTITGVETPEPTEGFPPAP